MSSAAAAFVSTRSLAVQGMSSALAHNLIGEIEFRRNLAGAASAFVGTVGLLAEIFPQQLGNAYEFRYPLAGVMHRERLVPGSHHHGALRMSFRDQAKRGAQGAVTAKIAPGTFFCRRLDKPHGLFHGFIPSDLF